MRALTRWFIIAAAIGLAAACGPKGGAGGAAANGDEMSLGSPTAKVVLHEYASVTCPHCARFNEDVFPALKAKYIDTGKVRYVFHEFLTPPESAAAAGFLVARCAGKEKYFSALDALFHSQNELYQSGDQRGWVFRVGRGAGLSDDKINACIQDENGLKALQARVIAATEKDKVNATPTFKIGDKTLEGEQTLAQFDAVLAPMLK